MPLIHSKVEKIADFFLSILSNRALYHPQAEELVSASDSCSSTIVFATKPRFIIHKYFLRV